MKTALIYLTITGHSKKIANAIAKELKIQAQDIKNNPQLIEADLLFIVGGIYGGKSLPELISYVKNIDNTMVKQAILITSCASNKETQWEVREILDNNGIEVLKDEFVCRGNFLLYGLGHPNKTDIENAVAFANKNVS